MCWIRPLSPLLVLVGWSVASRLVGPNNKRLIIPFHPFFHIFHMPYFRPFFMSAASVQRRWGERCTVDGGWRTGWCAFRRTTRTVSSSDDNHQRLAGRRGRRVGRAGPLHDAPDSPLPLRVNRHVWRMPGACTAAHYVLSLSHARAPSLSLSVCLFACVCERKSV